MINVRGWQKLDVGFSSAFLFFVWSIWGGFLLHMLLANYLAVLTKPGYEMPIRNIGEMWKKLFVIGQAILLNQPKLVR